MDLLEKALLELALVLLEEKRLITRKRSGKRATRSEVPPDVFYKKRCR